MKHKAQLFHSYTRFQRKMNKKNATQSTASDIMAMQPQRTTGAPVAYLRPIFFLGSKIVQILLTPLSASSNSNENQQHADLINSGKCVTGPTQRVYHVAAVSRGSRFCVTIELKCQRGMSPPISAAQQPFSGKINTSRLMLILAARSARGFEFITHGVRRASLTHSDKRARV